MPSAPPSRYGGALSGVRTDDLAAVPLRALMERNPSVDWAAVDDVIYGCANQAGEDNRNVGRMALLLAGLPVDVPGTTINRLCGSSLDAIATAARAIKSGETELMLAGGVREHEPHAPFVLAKATEAFSRAAKIEDTTIGWRFVNPLMKAKYGIDSMPETAENVAAEFGVSRADQDAFALRSQERAAAAIAAGRLAEEIVPFTVASKKGDSTVVNRDEHPRATTLESLAKLMGVVRPDGTVTPGNASGVNDGSCAVLLASEKAAQRHGLTPRARIVASAVVGVAPRIMGFGPAPAMRQVLAKARPAARRHGRDRAERGLRGAGARSDARPWAGGRRRARQSQRRRDCARSSTGRQRCAARNHRALPVAEDGRPLRIDDDVHRRGSRHCDDHRASMSCFQRETAAMRPPPHSAQNRQAPRR